MSQSRAPGRQEYGRMDGTNERGMRERERDLFSKLTSHSVSTYLLTMHKSIDRALAISYRRNASGGGQNYARFVARVTLVKAVPFYGFHVGYRYYAKIYLLNPGVATRLTDLLQQGLVTNQVLQPYEAHVDFVLQFMTDYNLYGCDYIHVSSLSFRAPVPELENEEDKALPARWHAGTIDPRRITSETALPRASHCALEVDICVQHILNRREVRERRLHHDFVEMRHPIPNVVKLVPSMRGLWKDETKRRKQRLGDLVPGSSPFPTEVLAPLSADVRASQPAGWIHEEMYREQFHDLVTGEAEEARNGHHGELTFENYGEKRSGEESVKTVLESVEDLFPENLARCTGLTLAAGARHVNRMVPPRPLANVNEEAIIQFSQREAPVPDEEAEAILREARGMPTPQKPKAATGIAFERTTTPLNLQREAPNPEAEVKTKATTDVTLLEGVGKSSLATGDPPDPSVSRSFLDFVQQGDWISESDEDRRDTVVKPAKTKRKESPPREMSMAKRIKLARGWLAMPEGPTVTGINEAVAKMKALQQARKQKASSISPSSSSPPQQKTTSHLANQKLLKFPVVKDSKDYTTRLHLSQKSSSQKSEDGGAGNETEEQEEETFETAALRSIGGDDQETQSRTEDSQVKNVSFVEDPFTCRKAARPQTQLSCSSPPAHTDPEEPTVQAACYAASASASLTAGAVLVPPSLPPSADEVVSTMSAYGLPAVIYQDPFYSNPRDVPDRPREFAGKTFRLKSNTLADLPDFNPIGAACDSLTQESEQNQVLLEPYALGVLKPRSRNREKMAKQKRSIKKVAQKCSFRTWEIAAPPPSYEEVASWWEEKAAEAKKNGASISGNSSSYQPSGVLGILSQRQPLFLSQIQGPTQKEKHDYKYSHKAKSTTVSYESQYMSTMAIEIHVTTRRKYLPDPEHDEVQAIFYAVKSDTPLSSSHSSPSSPPKTFSQSADGFQRGIIILSKDEDFTQRIRKQLSLDLAVLPEPSELDLLSRLVSVVREFDPDILTGYEVHSSSWGYLAERAAAKYDFPFVEEISRVKRQQQQAHAGMGKEKDGWGWKTTSSLTITGRHIINIWRSMRGELNLLGYSMENVAWHLLHKRVPRYDHETLSDWYLGGWTREMAKLLKYYISRVAMDLEILEANELVPRTSEQARLLGVDFFSVFSRGSQFKVESIMFRIAKPENYMLVSPSRRQVGGQNALECLPLVMEPQSGFYTSPVVVLDFQSLYPSVMIAYNYCYSTFLGRVADWKGQNKMGFTNYQRRRGLLGMLGEDLINISPNGMMFVKPAVRKSLLARMLAEILETRVMVKSSMREDKDDRALQQLLNNRQLALKLLANVTYGYTSASFSGRMPCVEIADAIVQTGRETLERAIAYIHSVPSWGAEVVYGDTDSLFIHLWGKSRCEAFEIGKAMAKAITEQNPRPVKLKFEKVYHPCVLVAKKRYVGYKYESPSQTEPEFDAKGIETVRRDGTPAEQKIEEKCLRLLFDTQDLSKVKKYFHEQCRKIARGEVGIQDFCFAKEVKLGRYSERGLPPPGAMVATKKMMKDERAEPQYGERVPYVVVAGAPGSRLVDRCVSPEELVRDPGKMLDAEYYVTKNIIPPLERIFNLVGADIKGWWDEMPKIKMLKRGGDGGGDGRGGVGWGGGMYHRLGGRKVMESFMRSANCIVCGVKIRTASKEELEARKKEREQKKRQKKEEEEQQKKAAAAEAARRDAVTRFYWYNFGIKPPKYAMAPGFGSAFGADAGAGAGAGQPTKFNQSSTSGGNASSSSKAKTGQSGSNSSYKPLMITGRKRGRPRGSRSSRGGRAGGSRRGSSYRQQQLFQPSKLAAHSSPSRANFFPAKSSARNSAGDKNTNKNKNALQLPAVTIRPRRSSASHPSSSSFFLTGVAGPPAEPICKRCASTPPARAQSISILHERLRIEQDKLMDILAVCHTCEGGSPQLEEVRCVNGDCPVFYSRVKQRGKVADMEGKVRRVIEGLGGCEW